MLDFGPLLDLHTSLVAQCSRACLCWVSGSAEHEEPESGLKNDFYISTENSKLRNTHKWGWPSPLTLTPHPLDSGARGSVPLQRGGGGSIPPHPWAQVRPTRAQEGVALFWTALGVAYPAPASPNPVLAQPGLRPQPARAPDPVGNQGTARPVPQAGERRWLTW